MAIASKLTGIGMIALSLAIGFLSFYFFSDLPKDLKKKHVEESISQLVNIVIFIWLGKILLHIFTFFTDPLSVLAYPSDSKAFYLAIVLTAFVLFYRSKKKNIDVVPLLESFAHLFLISSFVYEFIQYTVEGNSYAFGYLMLLAILIFLFFFLKERTNKMKVLMVLTTAWSIGTLLLLFVQPFVTVFGYMMASWFIITFFIISMIGLLNKFRKGDA